MTPSVTQQKVFPEARRLHYLRLPQTTPPHLRACWFPELLTRELPGMNWKTVGLWVDCITLARARPIADAFDDDGSGWISVLEANYFTSSRPLNYSVVKWLAFWAVGFPTLCARYTKAIENVRLRMVAMSADVHPSNRARVDKYMCSLGLDFVDRIVRAVRTDYDEDQMLMSHFNEFITSEEERLARNLEYFRWEIDAQNTLQLILGPSRIERLMLAAIFLLLRRHLHIMQLACLQALDDRELWGAECSLNVLVDAIYMRVQTLRRNFISHNLDPTREFEVAYSGMFKLIFADDQSLNNWEHFVPEFTPVEEPDEKILKYKANEIGGPTNIYRDISQDDEVSTHPFNGSWTGTYSYVASWRVDGLVAAHLSFLDDEDQNQFVGSGRDYVGIFDISGNMTRTDNPSERRIWFKTEYRAKDIVWAHRGTAVVDDSGRVIVIRGEWGPWVEDPSDLQVNGQFQLDRTLAIVARHRPPLVEFETNAARARWRLALNVVEEQVRQKLWSWSHFRQRRDDRKRFVDATLRVESMSNPARYRRKWNMDDVTDYEVSIHYLKTLNELRMRLRPEDIEFYEWIAHDRLERQCFHINTYCDSCHDQIVGVRYKCLECSHPNDPGNGVDLCEKCKNNTVVPVVPGKTLRHSPVTHTLLKTRRVIYRWNRVAIVGWGWEEKSNATKLFAKADKYREQQSADDQPDGAEKEMASEEIPQCFYCHEHVSRPCWFCVECIYDFFICDTCEEKQDKMSRHVSSESNDRNVSAPTHKWYHVLVQVKDIVVEPPRIELDERLLMLEQKFAAHESAMRQQLDSLTCTVATVNERVQRLDSSFSILEGLLTRLVAKLD
ncbi:hypothetical protein C8R47DRAFT_1268174 [Mycena vitilis]|nr:hypothetical protein C8R47DRAFT_1268174 [Mycena vitilis]